MRLLSAFTDTRVLLSLGAALVIQLVLLGLWVKTGQAEMDRKAAEIAALPPEEQVDAEFERLNRLAQEFAGERIPEIRPAEDPPAYVESEAEAPTADEVEAEAVLQAQIEALEREAMVRNEPAKPRGSGKVEVRARRAEPFLLTTTGILTVSCSVGALILFVGLAISFALLRITGGDKA